MLSRRIFPFASGLLMSLNFVAFWAVPITGMGLVWKHLLKVFLLPLYDIMDNSKVLRWIGENYIYTNPQHADFFATSILLIINAFVTVGYMFYHQFMYGYLPFWLIFLYYCSWVGVGGRIMGAAYALAHKEGHNQALYKPWIRNSIGHLFENVLGLFYGNVPWNFTTSHIFIHHKLDAGVGDTFYEWDIDRTKLSEFMLYVHRIFLHMIGYSSLKFFRSHQQHTRADLLLKGVYTYIGFGVALLVITRSISFVFWMYLQPLLCMSYFLALINIGFHGFIEFDEKGEHIPCVNATAIIEGDDDYFGEDDHMAHHYNSSVYFRDLPVLQKSKIEEFAKFKGSVFRKISIVELSIFILLGLWDKLADHYVDYSGKMTRDEIKELLKVRAKRLEYTYERYEEYLDNPTLDARKTLRESTCSKKAI